MFLGEYIKQYRSEHNMTMQEFADKASMTKGYVFMLELNKNAVISKAAEIFASNAQVTDRYL
jgi:transcriptional regulator with XRE-family HTH domain